MREAAVFVGEEVPRSVILDALTFIHNENTVRVNDCVEAMCDRQHRGLSELFSDQLLDLLLRDDIYISSSLIQHHDLVLS